MSRFAFSLESVRRWRSTALLLEEAKLRAARARADDARRRLEDLRAVAVASRQALAHMPSVDGADLAQSVEFQRFAGRESQRLAAECARWERDACEQLNRRNAAERDLQLIEKLRARQWADWRSEEARQLQQMADETHSARLIRQQRRLDAGASARSPGGAAQFDPGIAGCES